MNSANNSSIKNSKPSYFKEEEVPYFNKSQQSPAQSNKREELSPSKSNKREDPDLNKSIQQSERGDPEVNRSVRQSEKGLIKSELIASKPKENPVFQSEISQTTKPKENPVFKSEVSRNNKNESLSKILDIKTSNIKEEEQKKVEFSPRRVESDQEINNNGYPSRTDVKVSTLIRKFGDSSKKNREAKENDLLRDSVLRNLNVSNFKKLAKKDDTMVKSLMKSSKLVNSLGQHFMKKMSKFEEALKDCQSWNKKYTDTEFPPEKASLSKDWNKLTPKQKTNWNKYVWRRAEDIFGPDYDVFWEKIEPSDIKQGQLGDCYLLSSLSSLAEREYLVKKLFQPEVKSNFGLYSIWLNVNGIWTNVLIDDYFPCLNEKAGPAFSRGNGNELWVLILEKAYAKIFGSYHAIEGGNPAVALRDLIGAPYENKDEGEEDEMWEYIRENDEKGFILTCYTKSTMISEEENDLGLLSGHAYAILDHQEVKGRNGKDRIIQIRNPWGKVEWKGKWSDKSSEWTEELKAKLQLADFDDGTFWININDFRKYYEGVGICKYHENYFFDAISLNLSKKFGVCHMKLQKDCHLYISLNQKDERMFIHTAKNYQYSYMRLLLAKITQKGLKYIGGEFRQDQVLTIETELEAGDYYILTEVNWCHDLYSDVVINTYAENHTVLEEINNIEEQEFLQMQRNIIKSYALSEPPPTKQKRGDFYKIKHSDIRTYSDYEFGILYFYYKNDSPKTTLEETITMTKLVNLKVCPPLEDSNTVILTVLPQSDGVVMFKFESSESPSTSYGYRTNSKIMDNKKITKQQLAFPEIYENNYLAPQFKNEENNLKIIEEEFNSGDQNKNNKKLNNAIKDSNLKPPKDEERLWVSDKEIQLCENIDGRISHKINNWGLVFTVSLHISLIFVWLACFYRPDFLNLILIISYEALLMEGKNVTQKIVRLYFYFLLFAFIQDIVWFCIYTSDWVSENEYEPDALDSIKNCSIAFSYLDFFWKFWVTFCSWRFSIDYENMKKSVLIAINPFGITVENLAPVPDDQTQISKRP